jgi:spermidine synthase
MLGSPPILWIVERGNGMNYHIYGVKEVLVSKRTGFQEIQIVDSYSFGKCLILDGIIQSASVDEYIYHEALVHPAMIMHPNPRDVAIIGGGEGATLREVLKYTGVSSAIMVDIDDELVQLCKEYLPEWHRGALDDPRVKLFYMDARKFMEDCRDLFDVIIVDLSEPFREGPSCYLYTRQFYQLLFERMKPDGVISVQATSAEINRMEIFASIYKTMGKIFPYCAPYIAYIPSFSEMWGFVLGSKSVPSERIEGEEIERRIEERLSSNSELRFYDSITHSFMFSIPKDIRAQLKEKGTIIEDENPTPWDKKEG